MIKHFYPGHVNPLMSTGNYGATSNNMKLGGLLHLIQREGNFLGRATARPGPSSLYQM